MWRRVIDKLFRRRAPSSVRVEVLLEGVPVGVLTDRQLVDMFWYSYRVTELDPRVRDDELWQQSRLAFRDAASGKLCKTALAGGQAPLIREDRIMLRGLDFEDA